MKNKYFYRQALPAALLASILGLGGCVAGGAYYTDPYVTGYDYWYYPSVGVYYDNARGYYHYQSGGTWMETRVLPSYIYRDLGTYVIIDNPGPSPWYRYHEHRRYYPPERYRHQAPKPPPPRPYWDDNGPYGRRPSPDWRSPSNSSPPGGEWPWTSSRHPQGVRPPKGQVLGPVPDYPPSTWTFDSNPPNSKPPRGQVLGPVPNYPPGTRTFDSNPAPRAGPLTPDVSGPRPPREERRSPDSWFGPTPRSQSGPAPFGVSQPPPARREDRVPPSSWQTTRSTPPGSGDTAPGGARPAPSTRYQQTQRGPAGPDLRSRPPSSARPDQQGPTGKGQRPTSDYEDSRPRSGPGASQGRGTPPPPSSYDRTGSTLTYPSF